MGNVFTDASERLAKERAESAAREQRLLDVLASVNATQQRLAAQLEASEARAEAAERKARKLALEAEESQRASARAEFHREYREGDFRPRGDLPDFDQVEDVLRSSPARKGSPAW